MINSSLGNVLSGRRWGLNGRGKAWTSGEIWQSEGPRKELEPLGPARLSEIKFTCLKGFTDINFTFFFLIGKKLLKKKKSS